MLKAIVWTIIGLVLLICLPVVVVTLWALSPIIGVLGIVLLPAIIIGIVIGYKSKK